MGADDPAAEGVRSLERGLALLRAMNQDPQASVHSLARQIDVPRSTAYRLLETLVGAGYATPNPIGSGFRLTRQVRVLSDGFLDEDWLDRAWPILRQLGDDIVWPVSLFTQEAATMVIKRTTHARSALSIDYGMIGRRMPITETAAGKAYLAFCGAAEREVILALPMAFGVPQTQFERELLDRSLNRCRDQGYGTRVGGVVSKTSSISVPVVFQQRVLCCVSIIWFTRAMALTEAVRKFLARLNSAAATIAEISAIAN